MPRPSLAKNKAHQYGIIKGHDMRKPKQYKYHILSYKSNLGLSYIETPVEL